MLFVHACNYIKCTYELSFYINVYSCFQVYVVNFDLLNNVIMTMNVYILMLYITVCVWSFYIIQKICQYLKECYILSSLSQVMNTIQ